MREILIGLVFLLVLPFSVNAELVSHWSFDDSLNPGQDEVGGNDGTLVNDPTWTPNGFNNGAIIFDGMDDYIDCGNDNSLNMGTGNFSVSFWFKKGVAGDIYESLLYKSTYRQISPGYGFMLRETYGELKFTISDGPNADDRLEAKGPSVPDTEWHHVVGVRGGGALKLYLDNELKRETTDTAGSVDNDQSLVIGKDGYGNNPGGPPMGNHFRGKIDEVKIYNSSLSEGEINQIYYEDLANHREPPVVIPVSPAHEETNVSNSPTLNAAVTDPDGDTTDVSFYGSSTNASLDNFTIIALPDTQYYSQTYPYIFTNQTQWIVDKRDELNIVFVTHEGDIVEHWNSIPEWDNANASMSLLDGVVAWGVSTGNHDQEFEDSFPHNAYYYNQYFNYTRFEQYPWYGGHYGDNNDNNYQLFTAGGMDFVIVHLEYNPSSEALDWANEVISNHSDRRAIVDSHFIIRTNGERVTIGNNIFNALKDNPNLFMMLCGHRPGEKRIIDIVNGNTIHTLLSDYQTLSNGGNGYLRIMTFSPKDNKIHVRTYSPYTNRYIVDSGSHFDIDYSMTEYTEIGTNTGIESGSSTSMIWNNLANGTKYYWYASAVDSNSMVGNSEAWKFKTGPTDCDCTFPEICCNSVCITPVCSQNPHCGTDPCKDYTCSNPGTCSASCSSQDKTSCEDDDDCCPAGCDEGNDNDCVAPEGPVALYHFDENSGITVADSSGNGNDGTIYDASWTTGISGYALEFDGIDDYVQINFDPLQTITMGAWVYIKQFKSSGAIVSYTNARLAIRSYSTPIARFYNGTVSQTLSGGSWSLNEWNHIVVTKDNFNEGMKLYLNGELVAQNSSYTDNIVFAGTDIGVASSLAGGSSYYFNGTIDEVRIYNRVLTPEEILENYKEIKADINNNGVVDIFDLGIIAGDFGKTSGFNDPDSDTDNSGEIDVFDLVFVASRFT